MTNFQTWSIVTEINLAEFVIVFQSKTLQLGCNINPCHASYDTYKEEELVIIRDCAWCVTPKPYTKNSKLYTPNPITPLDQIEYGFAHKHDNIPIYPIFHLLKGDYKPCGSFGGKD